MEVRAKNGKGPLLFEWDSDTRTIGLVRKDMLLQKEYVADPISKKRKKNRGELPQYFVENSHEAIIPMETWQYVQDEMARRRELGCFANKSLTLNCFSTKIKCGKCGRSFVRSTRTNRAKISQLGEHYIFWGCTSKKKKNCPSCKNGTIRETVLMEECAKVLDIPEFDEEIFTEKVAQITAPETGTLIFDFTDGTQLTHHWSRNSKKESWTEECRKRASDYRREHAVARDDITCFTTKIKCEHCGCNFRKQSSTIPATMPPPTIAPAVARPDVIPAADSPTTPRP